MSTNLIPHWIGGKRVPSGSGRTAPVYDPATGEQPSEVGLASVEEVDDAVAAASDAFVTWRRASLSRRAEVMFRFRHLLDEHRAEIAAAVSSEHGKVRSDAAGELARGMENVEFACGIPALLKGGFSEQAATDVDVHSVRQPLGVVAGITPFNFPAMVPLWMLTTAIACGNTFVLKPSEKDPSASLLLAELLAEAGLPDGVFNVLQGDAVAVNRILEHPDIAAVSFVGSTPIARHVYVTGTAHGKRVQALGGAKNHMVVLPDADIEVAADAAVSAAYGSAGERCMAVSVVVAVGDDGGPDRRRGRGPTAEVERSGRESIPSRRWDRSSRRSTAIASRRTSTPQPAKARVVVDGRDSEFDGDGFFLGASLVDGVRPGMRVYDDEIFGPVLAVVRADTYEEALPPRQRQPVRQRLRDLHPRRRRGASVRVRRERRHGRRERPDPGAGVVLQLRWLEGVAVRRHRRCTARPASTSTRARRS